MKKFFTYLFVLTVTLLVSTSKGWAQTDPYLSQPLTFKANATTTVYLAKVGSSPSVTFDNLYLQFSTDDGANWEPFAASASTTKMTIDAGDSLMLRRNPEFGVNTGGFGFNGTSSGYTDKYWKFVTTGDYSLEGNIMSLIDGGSFETNTEIPAICCFNNLFISNTALKNIDNLRMPATTLTNRCYRSMFNGCKGITDISKLQLPATDLAVYCYLVMFTNTGITSLNDFSLPATTLAEGCYQGMFQSCTSLTTFGNFNFPKTNFVKLSCYIMFDGCTALQTIMPKLELGNIEEVACSLMFNGCKQLHAAPAIEVDSIGLKGCHVMFQTCGTTLTGTDSMTAGDIIVHGAIYNQGCQSMYYASARLKNAPAITATRVYGTSTSNGGCRYMFQKNTGITSAGKVDIEQVDPYGCIYMYTGCTKLAKVPELDVEKISNYSYQYMFDGCTGLTDISDIKLTADTLPNYCYNFMFNGCTGMTTAMDTFKVSVIGSHSCEQMFSGCNMLRNIPSIKVDSIGTSGCYLMFENCGKSLTGTDSTKAGDIFVSHAIGTTGCQQIYNGCSRLENIPNVTVGRVMGTGSKTGGCYYMFYGLSAPRYGGTFKADRVDAYGCQSIHNGCTKLASYDSILVDSVGTYGFTSCFSGCSSLKKMPKIKIRALGGDHTMQYMFQNCTSLTFANDTLFNKKLTNYCYLYMFSGCTGLTNINGLHLAADTLPNYCYNFMFNGCTGLRSVKDTFALSVIGAHSCEQMFEGCSYLQQLPVIHVDSIGTSGCYLMFQNCGKSLTGSTSADSTYAGDIIVERAIGTTGCQQMYNGCSRLANIPNINVARVIGGGDKTGGCYYMFYGLTSPRYGGTFKAGVIELRGCQGMHSGCTKLASHDSIVVDSIGTYGVTSCFTGCTGLKKLPVMKIRALGGDHTMQYMFQNCTSLTFANDTLFNKQLTNYCYYYMFKGCTSLTNLNGLHFAADTLASYAYSYMFSECSNLTSVKDTFELSVINDHACSQMFNSCVKLETTPAIKVDSIGSLGCYQMFLSCGTTPATLVASDIFVKNAIYNQGCQEMFSGCTKLKTAPNVFAGRIMGNASGKGGCYLMYSDLSLTDGGYIKAGRIDNYGCQQMFNKCTLMVKMDSIVCTDSIGTYGCYNMFNGCSKFTRAPKIDANIVGPQGLYQMYTGRTPLVSSDSILVNIVHRQGMEQMFNGCTGLTTLPHIEIDTIGYRGCEKMFNGCTSLELGNDTLPALKLGVLAYNYFFNGCTSISNLSNFSLPATNLSDSCYFHFFNGCTGLTDISTLQLPATILALSCYNNMFNSCTNITTAWSDFTPSVIGELSCYQMFNACKKLAAAPAIHVDSIGPKGCQQMFNNCSTSSTIGLSTAGDIVVNGKIASLGCNDMYAGCKLLATAPNVTAGCIEGTASTKGGCYRMFNSLSGLTHSGYLKAGIIQSYGCQQMFQGCTYLDAMDSIVVDSVGSYGCTQMFLNDTRFAHAPKITADVIGERGLLQLCDYTNCATAIATADTIRARKVYMEGMKEMFLACQKLAASPYIKVDTVGQNGCQNMFNGCYNSTGPTGILTADSVIIDKMGPYACNSMFIGCKRLTTIKGIEHTATDSYSCQNMFKTCTALADISNIRLKAQVLAPHCYDNMFNGCSALEHNIPELNVSVIGNYACYQMYNTCAKLRNTPVFHVDSIGELGCNQMFLKCNTNTDVDSLAAGGIFVRDAIYLKGCTDMFNGCTRLRKAPAMEVGRIYGTKGTDNTDGDGGCFRMYNSLSGLKYGNYIKAKTIDRFGCFSLYSACGIITMDSIIADSIAYRGCSRIFYECTAILHAPKMVVRAVGNQGCFQTFYSNKTITSADSILLGTVDVTGCQEMFSTCTGLLNQAYIQVDSVGLKGFYKMFTGCNHLLKSPKIVANTIGYLGCYQMFNACYTGTGPAGILRSDSVIVARRIGDHGCEEMFIGCQRMDTACAILTPEIGRAGCKNMFQNCFKANTGTHPRYSEGFGDGTTTLLADSACHKMFNTCTYLDSCADLRFSTIGVRACDNMFYLSNGMDVSPALTADKVKDYGCYQMFNYANESGTAVPVGFTRARDITIGDIGNYGCHQMFFQCRNLSKSPDMNVTRVGSHGCYQMFLNAYSVNSSVHYGIESAGVLNFNVVGTYGCAQMFSGCQKLETSPAITAVSIGSHGCEKMFYNCYKSATVGLKNVGRIVANTVANNGYANMFELCKRIDSIQDNHIYAEYMGDNACQNMFLTCTALKKAPRMDVDEMGKYVCHNMFKGCTALTTMGQLPTMKVGDYCYSHMFDGCTHLVDTVNLPVTAMSEGCYEYMFLNCSTLTAAPAIASTMVRPFCYQHMFENCALLTKAPVLAATELATNCYHSMFKGCIALVNAPALPAPELVTGCYTQMFNGDVALRYMKVNFTDWRYFADPTDPTYNWVGSVPNGGTFTCPDVLEKIFDVHHIPKTWGTPSSSTYTLTFEVNGGEWTDGTNEAVIIDQSDITNIPHPAKEGCMFVRWNTQADGMGDDLNLGDLPDEDVTYYAQYQYIGCMLHKWTAAAVVLSITDLPANIEGAIVQVVEGGASKSSYLDNSQPDRAVYQLVYNKSDVRLHPGGIIDVILTDNDDAQAGVISMQIPYLISSDTQSSTIDDTENIDVWVLPGATLTFNDDRAMSDLVITAGAKAVVPAGRTITTDNIVLRGGDLNSGTYSFEFPQLVVNGSVQNASGKVNYLYMCGLQQQYTIALPAAVNVADVTYLGGSVATMGVYRYNGEVRSQGKTGWEEIWDPTVGGTAPTLEAGEGYTIYGVPDEVINGKRRNYCYLNFPMTYNLTAGELAGDSKMVSVTHYGLTDGTLNTGVRPNDAGWNLIGNPYLATFTGTSESGFENGVIGELVKDDTEWNWVGTARYVVIPSDNGQNYTAEMVSEAVLPAFKNFFVQVGKGDALSFAKAGRAQNAPRHLMQSNPETMLGIRLEGCDMSDRMGLLLSDEFTEEYELNADLDKWPNQSLNIQAAVGSYNLAVAALNYERAAQPVALTVKTKTAGSYTFSLAEEWTKNFGDVEHLYLYDSETNTYTDLMNFSYDVNLSAKTYKNRFYVSVEGNFLPTAMGNIHENGISILSGNGRINIEGLDADAHVRVYTMMGACVFNEDVTGGVALDLETGVYVVRVDKGDETYTWKVEN